MVNGYCNTISDYTSAQGALPLFYSIRDCIPLAFPALLFGIFMILFAGQYFLIKNRTGRAKILIALLSSSFVMIPLSMLLALAQIVTYSSVMFYSFFTIIIFILFVLSDTG